MVRCIIGKYAGQKRMVMSQAGIEVSAATATQRLFDRSLTGLKFFAGGETPFYTDQYTYNFGVTLSEPPVVLFLEDVTGVPGSPVGGALWWEVKYPSFFDSPYGAMGGMIYLDVFADKFVTHSSGLPNLFSLQKKLYFLIFEV